MKVILALPVAFVLGGCALFAPKDHAITLHETGGNQIAVASTKGGMMVVGGATTFDGSDYETYAEHQVDTDTGTVIDTRHYVMIEGEMMDCPQSDCQGTVARHYGVPGLPSSEDTYIVR